MTRPDPHPVELMALAGIALLWAVVTIGRLLLVPLLAVLLLAVGWRPGPRAAAPQAPPVAAASAESLPQAPAVALACAPEPAGLEPPPLTDLTVAQLRRLARAAGLPRSLSRSGRKADLIAALLALEVVASS